MTQNYANHAHHPVPTYLATILTLTAMVLLIGAWGWGWQTLASGAAVLSMAVAVLVSMSRTYITRLQDRIILLEMKIRAAEVLPAGLDARLAELRPKQVVALRFASDEELGGLLERAARDKLPPREIKKAIQHWRGDYFRT
jgi:uncharacterized protein DUF6526